LAIIAGLDAGKSALPALAATMPLTADAAYTIVRRLLKGENIFRAHRQHIYQRLHISAGWTHGRVALVYVALTAIFALMVLFFDAAGAWMGVAIAVALIPTAERHITRMNNNQA
jgi:UDP-N-acetylmuramyl pentapeptide phosphotransferase/UDP-N-acetylglucosamine-1-phosphate transferase